MYFQLKSIKMFNFFDYLFYRICRYYEKHKEDSPMFSGIALLSLIQSVNLFILYGVICLIFNYRPSHIKLIAIGTCFFLVLFNGFRYYKFTYPILKEKWQNEEPKIQKRKKRFLIAYIVLILILTFILSTRNMW